MLVAQSVREPAEGVDRRLMLAHHNFLSCSVLTHSFPTVSTDEGTPRQSLNLRFSLTMSIEGLIGKRGTAVQLSNIECPFTLQAEYVDGDSGAKTMSGG